MMNQKFKKAADVSCWVCFLGILLSVYHHLFFFWTYSTTFPRLCILGFKTKSSPNVIYVLTVVFS